MAGTRFSEHLLTGLVSPFGTVAGGQQRGQGFISPVRDAMMDIRNPSEKTRKFEKVGKLQQQRREEKQRMKHPHGPIEEAVGGWLRGQ
jgi:hypothetical protein